MDAATLATVLKLLAQARAQLREAQSAIARGQAAVMILERLADELLRESSAEKEVR